MSREMTRDEVEELRAHLSHALSGVLAAAGVARRCGREKLAEQIERANESLRPASGATFRNGFREAVE